MFLDVSVKDMIKVKNQKVNFNEVIITRRDVIRIPKLMQYFTDNHVLFREEYRLDSTIPIKQNEIGLIFLEYYEYIQIKDGVRYFDRNKLEIMFNESETITSYLERSATLAPTDDDKILNIQILTTSQLNEIILNWFSLRNRNFRSIEKTIVESNNLYDINMNEGYFNKIVDPIEFLGLMFSRFVSIQKGAIPFSSNFGSIIKESLHRKADYFTKKIILEEVTDFVETLTSIYSEDFKLKDIEYIEEVGITTKLIVRITLEVTQIGELKFELK